MSEKGISGRLLHLLSNYIYIYIYIYVSWFVWNPKETRTQSEITEDHQEIDENNPDVVGNYGKMGWTPKCCKYHANLQF